MQDNLITDSAGIVWRVTDPATGRAERVTPVPSSRATRRPAETVRYFPPKNTTAPVDHGIPASVLTDVKTAMLRFLHDRRPGGTDAIRKAISDRYPDVHSSLRDEVVATYMASPSSHGPRGRSGA
jgi:hypothetical protein